jgi:hypothetical protein
MSSRPNILSISFSEYVSDARVLRQLAVLADYGSVTTLGYGPQPVGAREHLELSATLASLPQTPGGVAKLAARRFRSVELEAPATRRALELLAGRKFDLIVANEARALPLAHAIANGAPVWGDMHEWAPEERTHVLAWRILVAPFMRYLCARFLPRTAAVTTVNGSIARLYHDQFGCDVEVVRNAIALQDLVPSEPLPGRVRLVHSGAAIPGRSLETLIEATLRLDNRFTLDLFLVKARDRGRYWSRLRDLSRGSERIVFHDAVAPADLPATLNRFDLGVFVLPPRTTNHKLMLPNKFFDFVQARLGVVFSPAVETSALIEENGLGVITNGFSVESLVAALGDVSAEDIRRFKEHAHRAAPSLSSVRDEQVQRGVISRLLELSRLRG